MVKTINMMGVEIIIPDDMNFACYGKTIELFASEKKEEPKAIVHHKKEEDIEVLPPEPLYTHMPDKRLPRNMDSLVLKVIANHKNKEVSQIIITKNIIPQDKRKALGSVVKNHLNSMLDRGLLVFDKSKRYIFYSLPQHKR